MHSPLSDDAQASADIKAEDEAATEAEKNSHGRVGALDLQAHSSPSSLFSHT